MQSTFKIERNQKIIKRWLTFFMIMLALSGITAMPAEWELSIAVRFFDDNSAIGSWLNEIYLAVKETGNAGVEIAGPRAHGDAGSGGERHGGVEHLAVLDGR